jgi:F420-dependent methylenetetrahydromethanopterin dehydrogenase
MSKQIRVGISGDSGLSILSEGQSMSPDLVDQVIIPYSVPWENDVQLRSVPAQAVGGEEREMGPETLHEATVHGDAPNKGGEYKIRVMFQEYP